jgi:hypothetical protein
VRRGEERERKRTVLLVGQIGESRCVLVWQNARSLSLDVVVLNGLLLVLFESSGGGLLFPVAMDKGPSKAEDDEELEAVADKHSGKEVARSNRCVSRPYASAED